MLYSTDSPPLHVMMSFTGLDEQSSPYVQLLVRALANCGVQVELLSWRRLLTGRVQLLHVHWPETMLTRRTMIGRIVGRGLFVMLLARARFGRTTIVRTVHNRAPHESPSYLDRQLLGMLDRLTSAWINLNENQFHPNRALSVVIPHGELGSFYRTGVAPKKSRAIDVLHFGMIRAYKRVDRLIEVVSHARTITCAIAGKPATPQLAAALAAQADRADNITVDFRHIPGIQLANYITDAALVVLPYSRFENSGAALLSLDLGTPILVPRTESAELLERDFGADWVHVYDGPLAIEHLREALHRVAHLSRNERPVIPAREWPAQAAAHIDVYTRVADPRVRRRVGASQNMGRRIGSGT
ncbi:hypothetical protein ACFQ58_11850 [Agromyces sp. NPDC056523]|uniref:hypothetical protein n=1 Tax=Agromyces sp. NPDC056523 TaxID=3345850 RepID=UPI00366C3F9F